LLRIVCMDEDVSVATSDVSVATSEWFNSSMNCNRPEISTQDIRKSSNCEGVFLRYFGCLAYCFEVAPIDSNKNILSFSWVDSEACIEAPEITLPTCVSAPSVAIVSITFY